MKYVDELQKLGRRSLLIFGHFIHGRDFGQAFLGRHRLKTWYVQLLTTTQPLKSAYFQARKERKKEEEKKNISLKNKNSLGSTGKCYANDHPGVHGHLSFKGQQAIQYMYMDCSTQVQCNFREKNCELSLPIFGLFMVHYHP